MKIHKFLQSIFSDAGGWEMDSYIDTRTGNSVFSERNCLIEALKSEGIVDIPFDDLNILMLESACLANDIYVVFEEE